jgi:hypothetical protein
MRLTAIAHHLMPFAAIAGGILVLLMPHLSEALEQQAATSEVLRVISSSPGELEPVFQAMLADAIKLCEASYGAMWRREGDAFRNAAFHGALAAEYIEIWRSATVDMDSTGLLGAIAHSRKPFQVADLRQTRAYLAGHQLPVTAADVAGVRTAVAVPMLKDDDLIGAIAIIVGRTPRRPAGRGDRRPGSWSRRDAHSGRTCARSPSAARSRVG